MNRFGSDFFQTVMRQIPDSVCIIDGQGNIVAVNQAAEAMYGYSQSELENMRMQDLCHSQLEVAIGARWELAQEEEALFRTLHRRRSGEPFPVEIIYHRFYHDESAMFVNIIRDASKQAALEVSLQQEREKLQAAHEEVLAAERESQQRLKELLQKENRIERQNMLLMLVNQMSLKLMSRCELDDMMETFIRGATQLLKTEHGFVSVVDEEEQVFVRKASLGDFTVGVPIRLSVMQGMLGQVYRSGKMYMVDDYSQWEGRVITVQNKDLRCIVVVPLMRETQIIGAFAVAFREAGRIPPEEDLLLLERIGEAAAVAIDNALLQESRKQELLARKRAEDEVRRLAYTDSLTGLPNRAMLMEYLTKELERVKTDAIGGTVLFVDIDDLKNVNDAFGHFSGDKIIVWIGDELVAELGPNFLVARISADEFVVVLPCLVDQSECENMASRLWERICSREYDLGLCVMHVSVSMGIAGYPKDGETVEELFKNVDMALYEAKRQGKSTWKYFDETLKKTTCETMLLKQGLREAIQRSELQLVFQPVVNSQTAGIVGFESLLRWNTQDFGAVPPSRFIPLAEENGAIRPIGEWVIRSACAFAARLRKLGREDLRVTINISAKQLAADNFITFLLGEVLDAGLSTKQLELEITETSLIASMEDSMAKLEYLRCAEVSLALDDFGKGYSSLAYLKNLPVGTVKIDKEFIDDIPFDPARMRFVESIIQMAHGQNLRVTAEGVETEAQYEALRQCQCDYIQGYWISRPVSLEGAINLLKNGVS